MKFSAALALLSLATAMPVSKRAEDIVISISVNTRPEPQQPHHALHLDKEIPVCDEACPAGVCQLLILLLHLVLTTLVAMCRNLRWESKG